MSYNEYIVREYDAGTIHYFDMKMVHHRIGGPAVILSNGTRIYYTNGTLNRLDGPAYERLDGAKAYWIDGKEYSEADYYKKINPVKELTVKEISDILGYEVKVVEE